MNTIPQLISEILPAMINVENVLANGKRHYFVIFLCNELR